MQKSSQLKDILIGLLLVFALGAGVYWFAAALIDKLNTVQSDLVKTLVTAAVTVFVAVITLVFGKLWEQRQKVRQDLRDKKIPVYEAQIRTLFHVMMGEKAGKKKMTEQELAAAFASFTEQLVVWGSSDVIRAWGAFRTNDFKNDPMSGLVLMEGIFRAIRADLGNDVKSLKAGDILKLWINDYQTIEPSLTNAPAAKAK